MEKMLLNEIYLEIGQQKNDVTRIIQLANEAREQKNIEGLKLIALNYPQIAAKMLAGLFAEMDLGFIRLEFTQEVKNRPEI